jgi:GAF domain-containing protein
MRLPYFRKTEFNTDKPVRLTDLREEILSRILVVALVLVLLAVVMGIIPGIQKQEWGVFFIFGFCFLWTLFITLQKQIPYTLRALSLSVVLFVLGITTLLVEGLNGDGRLFLLALPVITAILLGIGSGIGSFIMSFLALGLSAFFMWKGLVPNQDLSNATLDGSMLSWSMTLAVMILLNILLLSALSRIFQGFETSTIGQKRINQILDIERSQLENRVMQRTREVNKRLLAFQSVGEITRVIFNIHDTEVLLSNVVELIKNKFDLYYVGVFLLDDTGTVAWLRAGSGETGKKMLKKKHSLIVDEKSLVGWACKHHKARIFLDVEKEGLHFENPELPLTRSEIALPIIFKDEVLGALSVQSKQTAAFNRDDLAMYQGIADALAIAFENARQFNQMKHEVESNRTLNREYMIENWQQVIHAGEIAPYTSVDEIGEKPALVSSAQFAIRLRDQVIGRLSLEDENLSLSTDDVAFIESVVLQAAQTLENIRLLQQTQFQAGYDHLLSEISRKVSGSTDLENILRTTVKELGQVLGASESMISLEIPTIDDKQSVVVV